MLQPLTLPAIDLLHVSGYFSELEQPVVATMFNRGYEEDAHEREDFDCITYGCKQFRGLRMTPFGFAVAM